MQTCNLWESPRQCGCVLLLVETKAAAAGQWPRRPTTNRNQDSKCYEIKTAPAPGYCRAALLFVLTGFVTAAASGSRTALLAADANDPTDGNITRITAGLLEHSQFSHHRLDEELAARFLDRYLDSLDPAHLLFLQSDAQEFDSFRSRLPEMTRREGDVTPARAIFELAVADDDVSTTSIEPPASMQTRPTVILPVLMAVFLSRSRISPSSSRMTFSESPVAASSTWRLRWR